MIPSSSHLLIFPIFSVLVPHFVSASQPINPNPSIPRWMYSGLVDVPCTPDQVRNPMTAAYPRTMQSKQPKSHGYPEMQRSLSVEKGQEQKEHSRKDHGTISHNSISLVSLIFRHSSRSHTMSMKIREIMKRKGKGKRRRQSGRKRKKIAT